MDSLNLIYYSPTGTTQKIVREIGDNLGVKHISEYNEELLYGRNIVISQHCYGCTAGAGSSCQGSVV